ncbi:hypothetical protein H8959_006564 [Pygathrix nigripes]
MRETHIHVTLARTGLKSLLHIVFPPRRSHRTPASVFWGIASKPFDFMIGLFSWAKPLNHGPFYWTGMGASGLLCLSLQAWKLHPTRHISNNEKFTHGALYSPQEFMNKQINIEFLTYSQDFFPKKKCFVFDRPVDCKKLAQLEKLHDEELDPEFVQQV